MIKIVFHSFLWLILTNCHVNILVFSVPEQRLAVHQHLGEFIFSYFSSFSPLFCFKMRQKNWKMWKSKFQLANVMQSTRFLVKIHNSQTSTDLMITYTVVGRPSCRLISLSRKEGIIIFNYSCLCTNIPIIALLI